MLNRLIFVITMTVMAPFSNLFASPLIFSNDFELLPGTIEFVSDESVLFTQVGDVADFEVVVKDYLGNIVNSGDVQWSLSSQTNLSVTNSQSRTATIGANSFIVTTVIVTAYHPGANATGQANIILADLNDKTREVKDTDVISGITPLSGNQSTIVLHKNIRTENIQVGDYVISGQVTGLLITVDAVSIGATEVTITASPATFVQVFDEFRFSGASQVTKYHAEVSAIDNTIKVYEQKGGKLIQQKPFYDAFKCELSGGGPVGFSLTGASMDFDYEVKIEPKIQIGFFSGFESFSLVADTTVTAGITTGALSFDSSISGNVNCKLTLGQKKSKFVLVKFMSFQLGITPELGFEIAANISGPSASITGPTGLVKANSMQGVGYTPSDGWQYISSDDYDYKKADLTGDFSTDLEYSISAELYALANIQLIINFGLEPPLGISLADISFMEIKAAEKLILSIASPLDPENINYTGPVVDLTGTFKITPKAELSGGNFVEFMKKFDVDATFNLAYDPLVDITKVHWKSPTARISGSESGDNIRISISTGNYLEDGTTFISDNSNNGTFSLVSENQNTLTGSISHGNGSVIWISSTDNEIFYPRFATDPLSRLLPYAGAPTPIGSGYTKLDASGNDLPDTATSWACARSNSTGLIWEVKTDNGGIHGKDNTYRWGGIGSLGTDGERYNDWDSLVNGSNSAGYCGGNNWRVPTIMELETIVDCGSGEPILFDAPGEFYNGRYSGCTSGFKSPTINTGFFPNTISSHFWSVSNLASFPETAWESLFGTGSSGASNRNSHRSVRIVRFGQ